MDNPERTINVKLITIISDEEIGKIEMWTGIRIKLSNAIKIITYL